MRGRTFIAFLLAVAACRERTPGDLGESAQGLHAGQPYTGDPQIVGLGPGAFATGTFIARRCVLTAAHFTFDDPNRAEVAWGPDASTREKFARMLKNDAAPGSNLEQVPGRDLRRVWVAPLAKSGELDERGQVFGTIDHDADYQPAPYSRSGQPLPLGTDVHFVGYGDSEVGSDFKKRVGEGRIVAYRESRGLADPDVYQIAGRIGAGGLRTNACPGDSGGPIFAGTQGNLLFGVAHAGASPCRETGDSYYTSVHAPVIQTWLAETIATYCQPAFQIAITSEGAAPETVIEARLPGRTASCAGSCTQRDLRAGPVVLDVVNAPRDKAFLRWEAGARDGSCPCQHTCSSPVSTVCAFDLAEGPFEQEMGGYQCKAVFGNGIEGRYRIIEPNRPAPPQLPPDDAERSLMVITHAGGDVYRGTYRGSATAGHGDLIGNLSGVFDGVIWRGNLVVDELAVHVTGTFELQLSPCTGLRKARLEGTFTSSSNFFPTVRTDPIVLEPR